MSGTGPPNLFLTLGRHRPLFRGWLRFAGRLMPGGKLPRRETELVILRVAHLRVCAYEFDHHVHLGARAGITAWTSSELKDGPAAPGWSSREAAVLAAVDGLHERQDLTDEEWAAVSVSSPNGSSSSWCMLVGHYEMLATAITALRIQPDRRRRG